MMKPTYWFALAASLISVGITCIEFGVKAYVADHAWEQAAEDVAKARVGAESEGAKP